MTRFLRRMPGAAIAAIVVWILLRPVLDSAVCWISELAIRAHERPRVTRLVVVDHRAQLRRADLRAGSAVPSVALTEIHFNTVVLLALFLSLGRPLSRDRMERLSMAWAILVLSQVVNLVIRVKFLYASAFGPWSLQQYSDLGREIYGYLQVMTDLPVRLSMPFALWVGFSWREIMQMIGREAARQQGP